MPTHTSHAIHTRPPHHTRRVRALIAASMITAAGIVSGCASTSHRPQVASLAGRPSASSHHSAATASQSDGVPDPDGRPRETLDDTNAEQAALYDPYLACLRAHRYVDATGSARLAVAAKCEHLEPLPAWQVDPSNPQARAFIGRTVTCLQARGYHARAVLVTNVPIQPPSWFVDYSPSRLDYAPTRPTVAQDACQQKALR